MEVAVRSYLAAGAAVVGATAIAISPVSPVVPADIKVPAVEISPQVELTALVNPIEAYFALAGNTVGNIAALGQAVLANPAPILRQVITNQLATAGNVLAALQTAGSELVNNLNTIGLPALQQAAAAIAAGNFVGAASNLVTAIVQPPLFAALPLLPALQAALEQPVANLLAVTQQFQTIVALTAFGAISPLSSTIFATGQAIQNVFDAAKAGNPLGAIGALMAAPAIIVDGFLNGYGADSGLLSPGLGPIGALLQIRDLIANAIKPAAPLAAASLPEATAIPTEAATTVSLSTTPTEPDATVASTDVADDTADASESTEAETVSSETTEEDAAEDDAAEEDAADDDSAKDDTATDDTATGDDSGTADSEAGGDTDTAGSDTPSDSKSDNKSGDSSGDSSSNTSSE